MNQAGSGELELRGLRKAYGSFNAVDGVNLRVREGEFVSLLGPSGCGKTTILRMVAGLIEPDNGQILLGGDDITRRAVHRRNVGLVFQSYALFPHLNVFENVAFGLRRRRVAGAEIKSRVERFLGLVQLDRHGARYPRELSGGQQQRVALARALVTRPGLLLLDEPLSNLDALLRDEMRLELKRLQEELGTTTVFVTHDQAEALTLSDRVAVLSHGRIEQFDTPENVYGRPSTAFVAGFVGRPNLLEATVSGQSASALLIRTAGGQDLAAATDARFSEGAPVVVALRPERLRLSAKRDPEIANSLPVTVVFRAFSGASVQYVVSAEGGTEVQVEVAASAAIFQRGDVLQLEIAAEEVIVLPSNRASP
jgi:putative spermidine/putrescine transport system ATP-binding protein